jgi:hypothetical protein
LDNRVGSSIGLVVYEAKCSKRKGNYQKKLHGGKREEKMSRPMNLHWDRDPLILEENMRFLYCFDPGHSI